LPFGPNCEWANMDACIAANQDKNDPSAWCATVMRETEEHCKGADEEKHMTRPMIVKTIVPYSGTPTAPRERAWNANAAVKRGRAWAGGPDKENISWPKYRRLFVRYDGENVEDFGSYAGPHHDVIDGELKTVFRGVAALAVVISGGRGGMSIPDDEVAGVKAHVSKHYHQFMDENGDPEKAPWERDAKTFEWLPEEQRIAARLKIDLEEARKALFVADAPAVAKDCGCSEDGGKQMSTVLIIRNDADVSEEIATPEDGVFEDDVAAISTDGGETWLEVEGGRVKEEAAGADDGAGDDAPDAEAEAAAEAETPPAGDDKDTQPDLVLDHSLLGELAETGYLRYFWNLTYALGDVLCGLIGEDDMTPDEKMAKGDKALGEFVDLAKTGFAEAVGLATDEEPEDPFAGMSYGEVIHTILSTIAPDGDGLDAGDANPQDTDEAPEELVLEVESLREKTATMKVINEQQAQELEDAKKLIDEILDMPLARKIDGDDESAVADIEQKYPWLNDATRRKLARTHRARE